MRTIIGIALCTLLPIVTYASVSFSEIAWMGSSESANYEWIELYNDGSAESVDGWQISDGQNLTITLAGTLPGSTFSVLERTSDASAPGSAFLIYTGALVNTGATLTLTRADGSIVDQVAGGENWQTIGGDNTTKDTAQYTSGGWVTGPATPGAANVTSSTEATTATAPLTSQTTSQSTQTTTATTRSARRSTSETVRLELPNVTLALAIDAQRIAYVNQAINLRVIPSGIGNVQLDSLQYEWNFGDGSVASGKTPVHAYQYPGKYVVTVYGAFGRHEQIARHEITVLPVTLTLDMAADGTVYLHNIAPYELDISGFVVQGQRPFTFPPRSIILPQQTITLPPARVLADGRTGVVMHDTEGVVVAMVGGGEAAAPLASISTDSTTLATYQTPSPVVDPLTPTVVSLDPPPPRATSAFSFASTSVRAAALLPTPETETNSSVDIYTNSNSDSNITSSTVTSLLPPPLLSAPEHGPISQLPHAPLSDDTVWPYLGLIALLSAAIGGLWFTRPPLG